MSENWSRSHFPFLLTRVCPSSQTQSHLHCVIVENSPTARLQLEKNRDKFTSLPLGYMLVPTLVQRCNGISMGGCLQ